MLMAGYPRVIATLWSIHDQDAPIVAEELYSYIFNTAKGDAGSAAYALHHAVARLRSKIGESEFIRWVPFIHMGL